MNIPARYLEKIDTVYSNITFNHLDFNQDGLNNDVVVVNHHLVCRFPRTKRAKETLAHEAKVLEVVQSHVELAVPRFEHLEDEFVSYQLIKGEPLSRNTILKLNNAARERVLKQLGDFHKQLHSIPPNRLATVGISSSSVLSREAWVQFYEQVENTLFPYLWRHQKTWIREHFEPVLTGELDLNYTPVLIHGDLGIYHILFDPTTQSISGIIDFGTAGLGDPATDIAVLLDNYGEELVRCLEDYPGLTHLVDRARFIAGTAMLQWALAGVQNHDTEMLLAHIGQSALDFKPVGIPFP